MFLSFFLCFTLSDIIPSSRNESGQLCGDVMCYTWCKRRYNGTELLSEECFSDTEELFCRTYGYGALICMAACIVPPIIIFILGKLIWGVFVGWFGVLHSLLINCFLGLVITGFICSKFEGYYFSFFFAFIPWPLVLLLFRFPHFEEADRTTTEDLQMSNIRSFVKSDKQVFIPKIEDSCITHSPMRMEYKYDQVPINEFKEMIKEVITVPPKPTIASYCYYWYSGKK